MGNFLSSISNKVKCLLLIAAAVFVFSGNIQAQCGLSAFPAFGGPLTPSNAFQATPGLGSGTYAEFNVTPGNIYSFYYTQLLDPNNGDDWDMTLSNSSAVINYNSTFTPI